MNRTIAAVAALFVILSLDAVAHGAAIEKPNIVLILLDNVGYGDLGCYGNGDVKTPHIDQLAEQGVRCTSFYTGSPSCMPSRAALLTSRHPLPNGLNEQIYKIDELEQQVLSLDEKLFPAYLRELDYATACYGKWNLGFAPGHRPTERGFDEYLGNISGNCDYVTHVYNGRNDLYRDTEPVELDGNSTAKSSPAYFKRISTKRICARNQLSNEYPSSARTFVEHSLRRVPSGHETNTVVHAVPLGEVASGLQQREIPVSCPPGNTQAKAAYMRSLEGWRNGRGYEPIQCYLAGNLLKHPGTANPLGDRYGFFARRPLRQQPQEHPCQDDS
jgi:hypothetical protein